MSTPKILLAIVAFSLSIATFAQDVTDVTATSEDISAALDLKAVASIFGDAESLEDFEQQLNDPELGISNLDLNNDGYVDYIRVVESGESNTHVILLQAIIGKDQYQDVATIEVEKDATGKTHVQVVGDVYMYGNDYIIEPVYVRQPVFFSFFWRPYYTWYWSSWYWGYYPGWYSPWRPYPYNVYFGHCHNVINVHHSYNVVNVHRSPTASRVHSSISRSDHAQRNPEQSFAQRNNGVTNKAELAQATRSKESNISQPTARSTGKQVNSNWKPVHERTDNKAQQSVQSAERNATGNATKKTSSSARAVEPNWKPDQQRTSTPSSSKESTSRGTRPSKESVERSARPSSSSNGSSSSSRTKKPKSPKPQSSGRSSSSRSKPSKASKPSSSKASSSRSSAPKSSSSRSSAPKSSSKRSK